MTFRNRRWLRTATLYYDKINIIVPDGFDLNDDLDEYEEIDMERDVEALHDAGIIEEERPERHTAEVANEFFDFAWKHLDNPAKLNELAPRLAKRRAFYRIMPGKIDSTLAKVLEDRDLAHKVGGSEFEWALHPVIGGLYMLFLARHMAGERPLISDNSAFQRLLCTSLGNKIGVDENFSDNAANALKLVATVCQTTIPDDLERMPIDSLLRMRETYTEHRIRFQEKISDMAQGLIGVKQEEITNKLNRQVESIIDEVENIKDKLLSQNITIASALVALTFPVWSALQGNFTMALASGMLTLSAGFARYSVDRKVIERSPWMYLVHASKLEDPWYYGTRLTHIDFQPKNDDEEDDPRIELCY